MICMSETDFIRGDNMKKLILFMSVLTVITLSGCGNKAKAKQLVRFDEEGYMYRKAERK